MEVIGPILLGVGTIVSGIGSLAAWRRSSQAAHQTNGLLQEPLQEIRTAVLDTQVRMTRVEGVVLDHIEHHPN